MNRLLSAFYVVALCITGAVLFYLPWTSIWERNYFLTHFPSLLRILLHPALRGAVSGLGVLDIFVGLTLIGPDAHASSASPAPPPAAPSRVPPQ